MSDGISDGHTMTEDAARETLFLLEILRILFEKQNEGGRFSSVLDTLKLLKVREEHNAHLPETMLEGAQQEAERLAWTEADLDGNEKKEWAWANLMWDLLEEGVFRTASLFKPVTEISILPIDFVLAYGDIVPGKRKLIPRGNEAMFRLWMEQTSQETEAIDPGNRRFLLGFCGGSVNLYSF